MIVVELPFPSPKLSPNARLHWAVVSKAKKAYRSACYFVALSAYQPFTLDWTPTTKLRLAFTFYPPTNRKYDWDNLIARMKAGIDGLADGFGIDDKHFTIGNIDIAPAVKGGMVRVHISEVA